VRKMRSRGGLPQTIHSCSLQRSLAGQSISMNSAASPAVLPHKAATSVVLCSSITASSAEGEVGVADSADGADSTVRTLLASRTRPSSPDFHPSSTRAFLPNSFSSFSTSHDWTNLSQLPTHPYSSSVPSLVSSGTSYSQCSSRESKRPRKKDGKRS
jgi:hypothetical protein